jgi:plastocyanin
MHTRTFVLFSVAAVALITLAACSSSSSTASLASGPSSSSSSSGGKITIGSDQANDHGTEDATGKTSFEIEASNDSSGYFFKPTILQGSGGQSITLEIKNDGSVLHNFSITSMNVNINIDPGASQEVKVTFPQSGTVEYFCSIHHALGMAGELSVA